MSEGTIYLISAFGRSETLALAMKSSGFDIKIVDFTSAFSEEYLGGAGPFPIIDQEFLPAQRTLLETGVPLHQGLSFWLKEGPLELTGPMSETHGDFHPEIRAWKTGSVKGEFERVWLGRFLSQWASPYLEDSWLPATPSKSFPADQGMVLLPERREVNVHGFTEAQSKGVEVLSAHKLLTVQTSGSRLSGIEIFSEGSPRSLSSEQWVWCLSGFETSQASAADAVKELFPRGVREPHWQWLSFAGSFVKGPWSQGLPRYTILLGDVYLPWTYANAVIVRRVDETQFRFWLKVPRERIGDIDARRAWAADVQARLLERLPLAEWKVDSGDWGVCPHSPVYLGDQAGEGLASWKNWDWLSAETMSRLDLNKRFERESDCFHRLSRWQNDRLRKSGSKEIGGPRDRSLHAP